MVNKNMFEYENKYKKYGMIAGIDEAGRGPLAGPVVVACVIMPLEEDKIIQGIDDSKKLSSKKREILFDKIIETAIDFSIIFIDEKKIDEINILNATKLGIKKCIESLDNLPYICLIDAVKLDGIKCLQENIIHGDAISYNIASASILAKVSRDRYMTRIAEKYPQYQFEKHKGYGTKIHIEALKKYGKCEIHRETFIKNFV